MGPPFGVNWVISFLSGRANYRKSVIRPPIGRRRMVGGQEDMITDVALTVFPAVVPTTATLLPALTSENEGDAAPRST